MENFDRKNITLKRIGGRRIFLFASTAAALVADIIVFVLLMAAGITDGGYIAVPVILLVADLAFLLFAIFSNFRFKYSLFGAVVFTAIETIAIAIMLITLIGAPCAMSSAAGAFWLGLHALVAVAATVLALGAAKLNKAVRYASVALAAFVVAGSVGYGVFASVNGVFGQGIGISRTLTFAPDDDGEGYIVTGYVKGNGDTAVIPDTFDGKPVTGIDCAILSEVGITTVNFECSAVPKLYNVSALSDFTLKTVGAKKANIDAVRGAYFKQAYEYLNGSAADKENVDGIVRLAQAFYPSDLASDEKYVTFDYSANNYEALRLVEGEALPVWIGKSNQSFSVADYDVEYAKHAKIDDDADLDWSYKNLDGRILSITYNGAPITSTSGVSVHGAVVSFDKIYKITVGADNDDVYETDERFTTSAYGDFIYAVESNADKRVLNVIPARAGFDLGWEFERDNDYRETFTSLSHIVAALDGDSVTIHPVWKLMSPVITALASDKTDNTVTYGDPVAFTAAATAPADGFALDYEWSAPATSSVSGNGTTASVATMGIDGGGAYSVRVTASNPEVTSLTSVSTRSISVTVVKRPIRFTWSELESDVYDATEKPIVTSYSAADVVAGDSITYNVSSDTVRDKGSYPITVALSGDAAKKYEIASGASKTYQIKPCEIDVVWDYSTPYVYNGTDQGPAASATSIITENTPEYDRLNIKVSEKKRDYGTYTATVDLGNANYTPRGNSGSCVFAIEKREITPVWNDDAYTYTGSSQRPSVASVVGAVAGETDAIMRSIAYGGAQTNATQNESEPYTATATLPANGNYKFNAEDTPATKTFTIAKKAIKVTPASPTVTYNGRAFTAFDCTATGLVNNESIKNSAVATLDYSLTSGEGKNVGIYTITVDVTSRNYAVTTETGTLTINPANLNFIINNVSETYAGNTYDSTRFGHSVVGLQNGELESDVLGTITYAYKRVSETTPVASVKNCGVYDVTASFSNEGGESYNNYTVSVRSGQLAITKAALTITAENKSKVYDGNALTEAELTYTVRGLVGSEDIGAVDGFSIECDGIDAGTHTIAVSATGATNYEVACVNGTLSISPKPITVTATTTAANNTKVYDGRAVGYSFSAPGLVAGDTLDVEFMIVNGRIPDYSDIPEDDRPPVDMQLHIGSIINAGTYTIVPSATHKNYTITTRNVELTIEKKQLTITASGNQKTYDGTAFEPTDITYTVGGYVVLDESEEGYPDSGYSVSVPDFDDFIDVGTRAVTVTASGMNYISASETVELKIDPKPITVSVVTTAQNNTKVYDGRPFVYTYEANGLVSRDTLNVTYVITKDGSAFTGDIVDAGEYVVTPSVTHRNYTITRTPATLTITKAPLTIIAENNTKTYDGARASSLSCRAIGIVDGKLINEIVAVDISCAGIDAGTHTIAITGGEATNYDITYQNGTLTINKKALTIKADDKTKTYGEANPAFTCTATGLVGGETLASVTAVSYACTGVNVGAHDITVTATAATNYTITCQNGTLTINKKALTIKADDKTKTYGEANPAFTCTATGLVNGETLASVTEVSYTCDGVNVGTHDITVSATAATNYTITCQKGTLTITPKPVTVTAKTLVPSGTKVYDGKLVAYDFDIDGVVAGDKLSVNATMTKDGKEHFGVMLSVGEYAVIPVVTPNDNYTVTCIPATLIITKATITIAAENKSKVYDGTPFTAAEVYSTSANDNSYIVTTSPRLSDCVNVGEYTVTITAYADDYETATKTVKLTVTKKSVTLDWTIEPEYTEGEETAISASTGVDGLTVTYEYYTASGDKLDAKPREAGEYKVKAVTENGNYALTNSEQSFKIVAAGSSGGAEEEV